MKLAVASYVGLTQYKGQAMTEYALLLAAIAVVALITYQAVGNNIVALLNSVIADL